MKVSQIPVILVFIFFSLNTYAQTVYSFTYNFQQPEDNTEYSAFFIRHLDGTAIVRVLYAARDSKDSVLAELNMREHYIMNNTGLVDTSSIIYTTTNHRILSSNQQVKFNSSVAFIFKSDPETGFSEPYSVIANDSEDITVNPGTSFFSKFYEHRELKPAFVKRFINPEEDLFKSIFAITSRGGTVDRETKMYLLVVANILDKDIGEACIKDTVKVIKSFTDIASKLGLLEKNVIIQVIAGTKYNKKNVELAIKNLKPVPDKDIVVFYYTGHGFRKPTERKISQFPFLDLRSKTDSNYMAQSLNIEKDIFNKIVSKGARFNLVLGDCCNTYVPLPKVESPPPPTKRGSGFTLLSEDNCRTLFLEKMSILACAADSNQLAAGNRKLGSFFSYFFYNNMENYCSVFQKDVSWKKILEETATQTIDKANHTYCDKPHIPANICNQKPIQKTVLPILRQ